MTGPGSGKIVVRHRVRFELGRIDEIRRQWYADCSAAVIGRMRSFLHHPVLFVAWCGAGHWGFKYPRALRPIFIGAESRRVVEKHVLSPSQFGLFIVLYLVGGSLILSVVVELIVRYFKRRERR